MTITRHRIRLAAFAAALAISAGAGTASAIDSEEIDGCCYPGTKTYLDAQGKAVGYETIGCGADGVLYGTATNRFRWQPGCAL